MSLMCVLLSVAMLLTGTVGARVASSVTRQHHSYITEVTSASSSTKIGDDDTCSLCVEFAEKTIDGALRLLLQGITGTCGDLCQIVWDETGSNVLGFVCTLLCDIVGVKEFVNIIDKYPNFYSFFVNQCFFYQHFITLDSFEKPVLLHTDKIKGNMSCQLLMVEVDLRADFDPIYYCELIPVCPINDNGDAKFTYFQVDPKSGPQGVFDVSFEYVSQNGTGTGQIVLDVYTADGIPLSQRFLHELAPAGTYDGTFKLKAEADPDCDSAQGPCEQWLPGDYLVKIALCNGVCGNNHPHSAIYDEASARFTITDNHSI